MITKLIIAGSRHIDEELIYGKLVDFMYKSDDLQNVNEIVSGTAKGADSAGELFADFYDIKCTRFPANWDEYGKRAGMLRNREMANYGEALLLIWDGKSRGSSNMKEEMKKLNKPVYEIIINS